MNQLDSLNPRREHRWNAGAIAGADAIVVSVDGAAATDGTAIDLLKETIKRRSKQH